MTTMLTFPILVLSVALAAPALAQTAASGARQTTPRPTTKVQPAKPSTGQHDRDRQGPQGFSVVLVLGDMQGTTAADNVPMAARKALADMKDFLPYKSYRLLDTQWSLCCGRSALVSRLRGADGQEYDLELNASVIGGSGERAPAVSVRFQLTEAVESVNTTRASPADRSPLASELHQQIERLEQQLSAERRSAEQRFEVGTGVAPDRDPQVVALESRLADLKIKSAQAHERSAQTVSASRKFGRRPVIDTSFRMDVGETVVVGTSRVKGGDKALIALLTAVAPRAQQGAR